MSPLRTISEEVSRSHPRADVVFAHPDGLKVKSRVPVGSSPTRECRLPGNYYLINITGGPHNSIPP
jgi:hypothetical protein